MRLPINIEELLSGRAVEGDRIEYKTGWNPDAIYRTICAFANDFDETGGGYIVVGVKEENGHAIRPVTGIDPNQIEPIEKKMVRFLAATGARVSELVQLKVEHVNVGYYDIYTKGGKIRRLFIPKKLRDEAQEWLSANKRESGYLFLNRFGERITTRGIAQQLKNYAVKYGLNPKVVYPHSFRHRYAKNFLEKFNDISLLADLMGHESIETTRIYLRRTASEQQAIVDKVITW